MLNLAYRLNFKPVAGSVIAGLAFLCLCTSSCSPSPVASASPAEPHLRATGTNSDAWVVHVGEQSLFTMWISPNISTAPGDLLRFITMVGHLPGSAHPFFGQQTQVDVNTDREITSTDQAGLYSLRVRPNPGLMWGDVKTKADCQVDLVGFF